MGRNGGYRRRWPICSAGHGHSHFEWWGAQQRNKRLLSTFSRYVGPSVLNEMVRRGLEDSLTPTQRSHRADFADMEGFTRTTYALPADRRRPADP